jgi:hypothetical protein
MSNFFEGFLQQDHEEGSGGLREAA